MKKCFVFALLALGIALSTTPAAAGEDSTHEWFGNGLAWYEHPCGLAVFAQYGQIDTPEVRQAYQETRHDPEGCRKPFTGK